MRLDPEKREEWDLMLTSPFPGEKVKASEEQIRAEGQSFLDLMAQVNGA